MVKIEGIDDILTKLRRLRTTIPRGIAAEFGPVAAEGLGDLKTQTGHPFQEVPSYLVESRMGLPGRKQYPTGTPATFARTSAPLTGTPWYGQTQLYLDSTSHPLRDLLQSPPPEITPDRVTVEIGYPPEAEVQHPEISWVHWGTKKLQPRPFLTIAYVALKTKMIAAAERGILRGVVEALRG